MPPRSRRRLGRTAITAIRLPREPRHWALIEIVLVIALKLLIVVGSPHGLLVIGPPRPEHRGSIVIEPTEPLAPLAAHDPAALEILQAVTGRSNAAAWASRWRCSSALTRSARDGSFDAASALVDRLHDGQYAQPASSSWPQWQVSVALTSVPGLISAGAGPSGSSTIWAAGGNTSYGDYELLPAHAERVGHSVDRLWLWG